jgi:hypothetical protein
MTGTTEKNLGSNEFEWLIGEISSDLLDIKNCCEITNNFDLDYRKDSTVTRLIALLQLIRRTVELMEEKIENRGGNGYDQNK